MDRFGNREIDMWVNDINLKCSFLPRDQKDNWEGRPKIVIEYNNVNTQNIQNE